MAVLRRLCCICVYSEKCFFQMTPEKSQCLYKKSRLEIQKDGLGSMVLLLEGFQQAILTQLDLKKVIIYTCNSINTSWVAVAHWYMYM